MSPTISAMVTAIGANTQASAFYTVRKTIDLKHITVQHIMGSHFETECTIWLDAARVYPSIVVGMEGERSQVQIHEHPLPNVRPAKGQVLEFRLNNLNLPSSACQTQTAIFMLVAEFIAGDEALLGDTWTQQPYIVETYITESATDWLSRQFTSFWRDLKERFGV